MSTDVNSSGNGPSHGSRSFSQAPNDYTCTKRMEITIPLYPSSSESSSSTVSEQSLPQIDTEQPMITFGGNLAKPSTLSQAHSSIYSNTGSLNQPIVTFCSQEPIVAHSIAQLWGPSSTPPSMYTFSGNANSTTSFLSGPRTKLKEIHN